MDAKITIEQFLNGYIELKQDVSEIKGLLREQQKPEEPKKRLMILDEAAKFLSLSKASIYRLVSERKIPFHKTGGKLYFLENELLNWIKSGRKVRYEEA
ncbi:MAG: helix-turn-helix domain-containing protein [Candidatus Cloacimonadota bacterium]|nr:helix-turn-helix domain-containing protein [Candidatus Cloacimonadota bacterium]